jgi:hemolysin activation/secretion protein
MGLVGSAAWAMLAVGAQAQGVQSSPIQQLPGETADRPRLNTTIALPNAPTLQAPAGADGIVFELRSVRIDGGQDALNTSAMAKAPMAGSQMSVEQLFAYAASIQQLYFEAGFPLSRVIVPAQDLQSQSADVRILVVNGFIDRIDTSNLHPRVRGQVEKMLRPLLNDESISAKSLERHILLAGETAGVSLQSALSPGATIGAVTLVASGDYKPIDGVISIDNRVLEELGREQVTLSAAFNSILGSGEKIVLTAATALQNPGIGTSVLRSFVALNATAPIGRDGLALGVQAIYASNAPAETQPGLLFDNEFWRVGINASYALVRSRRASSTLTLAFDASDEEQQINFAGITTPLFKDRIRALRLGMAGYGYIGRATVVNYDLQFSQGIDALGARSAAEASFLLPLSRDGADATFSKLEGGATVLSEVTRGLKIQATARGMTGFGDPLVRSEQASFASPALVSGPPPGSVIGDRMIGARLELQSPQRLSKDVTLEPYFGAAAAYSKLERPTTFELPESDATAVGLGMRLQVNLSTKITLSSQLEWMHVNSPDLRLDDDWFNFVVALRF